MLLRSVSSYFEFILRICIYIYMMLAVIRKVLCSYNIEFLSKCCNKLFVSDYGKSARDEGR